MQHTEEKNLIYIPILLMLAFLLLPLLKQREGEEKVAPDVAGKSEQTGFLDYDLLPEELKMEMKRLRKQDSTSEYYFSYFFEVDDINHRYYITDAQQHKVKSMPVTNQEVFTLIEEKMAKDRDRDKGYSVSYDTRLFSQKTKVKPEWYKGRIAYVLPEDKEHADFRKLRVGILKEEHPDWLAGYHYTHPDSAKDTKIYRLSEVDEVPKPIRGIAYFKEVVKKEIRKEYSFLYPNLSGDVVAEFTVGGKAKSPQVIRGFSTRSESYEAYRADGAIIKAINNSKVHWIPAKRQGKYVDVRLAITFSFDKQQNQEILLSMSDLQEPTEVW